jgi:hypothetical protein
MVLETVFYTKTSRRGIHKHYIDKKAHRGLSNSPNDQTSFDYLIKKTKSKRNTQIPRRNTSATAGFSGNLGTSNFSNLMIKCGMVFDTKTSRRGIHKHYIDKKVPRGLSNSPNDQTSFDYLIKKTKSQRNTHIPRRNTSASAGFSGNLGTSNFLTITPYLF